MGYKNRTSSRAKNRKNPWIAGGLIALAGALVYAGLAALRPEVGGQYAYLREAYHPSVAFIYGWSLLLVTQTGGMAAVAVTFAHYFLELTRGSLSEGKIAAAALLAPTFINCFGVRAGSRAQSTLMVMKIFAIGTLVICGWLFVETPRGALRPVLDRPPSLSLVTGFGAAMAPVLFGYGGWQTSCFAAGEMIHPEKNLPRGLMIGVTGVVVLLSPQQPGGLGDRAEWYSGLRSVGAAGTIETIAGRPHGEPVLQEEGKSCAPTLAVMECGSCGATALPGLPLRSGE